MFFYKIYQFMLFFSFPFFLYSLGNESMFLDSQSDQQEFISEVMRTGSLHTSVLDKIVMKDDQEKLFLEDMKTVYTIKNCPDYVVAIFKNDPISQRKLSTGKSPLTLARKFFLQLTIMEALKKYNIKSIEYERNLIVEGNFFKNNFLDRQFFKNNFLDRQFFKNNFSNNYYHGILMKNYKSVDHLTEKADSISLKTFEDFYEFLKITHTNSIYLLDLEFLLNTEGEFFLTFFSIKSLHDLYIKGEFESFLKSETSESSEREEYYSASRFCNEMNILKKISSFFYLDESILDQKLYDIYKEIVSIIFNNRQDRYSLVDDEFLNILSAGMRKGGLHKDLVLELYQMMNLMNKFPCSSSIHTNGSSPFSRGMHTAVPFSPFPVFKHSKVDVFQQQPVDRTPSVNSPLRLSVFKHPWEKKLLFPLSKGGTFGKILGPLTLLGGSYLMFHNKKTLFQPVQLRDDHQMIQASS